jgi:hypothetical protein
MTHLQLVPRVLQVHPNGPACPPDVKGGLYFREVGLTADYRARRAAGTLRNKRQLAAFVKRAVTRAVKGGNLPAVALDSRIDVYHADPEDSGVVDSLSISISAVKVYPTAHLESLLQL